MSIPFTISPLPATCFSDEDCMGFGETCNQMTGQCESGGGDTITPPCGVAECGSPNVFAECSSSVPPSGGGSTTWYPDYSLSCPDVLTCYCGRCASGYIFENGACVQEVQDSEMCTLQNCRVTLPDTNQVLCRSSTPSSTGVDWSEVSLVCSSSANNCYCGECMAGYEWNSMMGQCEEIDELEEEPVNPCEGRVCGEGTDGSNCGTCPEGRYCTTSGTCRTQEVTGRLITENGNHILYTRLQPDEYSSVDIFIDARQSEAGPENAFRYGWVSDQQGGFLPDASFQVISWEEVHPPYPQQPTTAGTHTFTITRDLLFPGYEYFLVGLHPYYDYNGDGNYDSSAVFYTDTPTLETRGVCEQLTEGEECYPTNLWDDDSGYSCQQDPTTSSPTREYCCQNGAGAFEGSCGCPSNMELIDGTCQCPPELPVWDDSLGVCTNPQTAFCGNYNGTTFLATQTNYPSGTTTTNFCAEGNIYHNGNPVSQPPYPNQGQTVNYECRAGASTASCWVRRESAPDPAQCGTADRTYQYWETAYSGSYCNVGSAVPSTPAFPSPGSYGSWNCEGTGLTTESCSPYRQAVPPPPPPTCGPAERNYAVGETSYTQALCGEGTASPLNPPFPATGGSESWNCVEGTQSVTCTATRDEDTSPPPCNSADPCCRSDGTFESAGTVCNTGAYACAGSGSPNSCSRQRPVYTCTGSSSSCPTTPSSYSTQYAPSGQVCNAATGNFVSASTTRYCGQSAPFCSGLTSVRRDVYACGGTGACNPSVAITQRTINTCAGEENDMCYEGACTDACFTIADPSDPSNFDYGNVDPAIPDSANPVCTSTPPPGEVCNLENCQTQVSGSEFFMCAASAVSGGGTTWTQAGALTCSGSNECFCGQCSSGYEWDGSACVIQAASACNLANCELINPNYERAQCSTTSPSGSNEQWTQESSLTCSSGSCYCMQCAPGYSLEGGVCVQDTIPESELCNLDNCQDINPDYQFRACSASTPTGANEDWTQESSLQCSTSTNNCYCGECSSDAPYRYGGTCNVCPQSAPYEVGGACQECPAGETMQGGVCVELTQPVIDFFTADPNQGVRPLQSTLSFRITSSTPVTYDIAFGDGNTFGPISGSTLVDDQEEHTYTSTSDAPTFYTATLTATNAQGQAQATAGITVTTGDVCTDISQPCWCILYPQDPACRVTPPPPICETDPYNPDCIVGPPLCEVDPTDPSCVTPPTCTDPTDPLCVEACPSNSCFFEGFCILPDTCPIEAYMLGGLICDPSLRVGNPGHTGMIDRDASEDYDGVPHYTCPAGVWITQGYCIDENGEFSTHCDTHSSNPVLNLDNTLSDFMCGDDPNELYGTLETEEGIVEVCSWRGDGSPTVPPPSTPPPPSSGYCSGTGAFFDSRCHSLVSGEVVLVRDDGTEDNPFPGTRVIARATDPNGNIRTFSTPATVGDRSWSMPLPPGTVSLTPELSEQVGEERIVTVVAQEPLAVTPALRIFQRVCQDGCANQLGLCDRGCLGVLNCPAYDDMEVDQQRLFDRCAPEGLPGRPQGSLMQVETNSTHRLVGNCCALEPPEWRPAPRSVIEGDINNLIRYTRLVTVDGMPLRLVVASWN